MIISKNLMIWRSVVFIQLVFNGYLTLKNFSAAGKRQEDSKKRSVNFPISAMRGEFMIVVARVPRPMPWKDEHHICDRSKVISLLKSITASTRDITRSDKSKVHLTLLIFFLKTEAISETKSSYTCRGRYVRKKQETPNAVIISPTMSITQRIIKVSK